MCTHYFLSSSKPELENIINEVKVSPLSQRFVTAGNEIKTEGMINPTDVVPVLAPNPRGEMKVYPMKWGYTNIFKEGTLLLNARLETAFQKPTFRYDWLNHRCIIPASYYFEWAHFKSPDGREKTGDRFAIQPSGCTLTWLCGLYRIENGYPVFVILTKAPTVELSKIHDRMPLMLPKDRIEDWINPSSNPEELLSYALTDMIIEKAEG